MWKSQTTDLADRIPSILMSEEDPFLIFHVQKYLFLIYLTFVMLIDVYTIHFHRVKKALNSEWISSRMLSALQKKKKKKRNLKMRLQFYIHFSLFSSKAFFCRIKFFSYFSFNYGNFSFFLLMRCHNSEIIVASYYLKSKFHFYFL